MKKEKILYFGAGSGWDQLFVKISNELEKLNFESHFISFQKFEDSTYKQNNKKFSVIREFEQVNKFDLSKITFAEKKYDFKVFDAWSITYPRYNYWKIKKDDVLKKSQYVIERIEKILDQEKPDYLLCYGIAAYHVYIVYKICIAKGIKVLELANSRLRDRFVIKDNFEDQWPLLNYEYEKRLKYLSPEDLKISEIKLKELCQSKVLNQTEDKYKESLLSFLKRFFKWTFKHLKYRSIPPELSFIKYKIKEKLFNSLGYFEKPEIGKEKFIFYPLHYQPEASTLIYGKYYVNQINLIENLAKSLPANYMLYVKEHGRNAGARPFGYHNQIKKLPNVRLLSPKLNPFNLIEKSSLIVTITGTIGFEALIRGKPVITFGDVYYNTDKNITKIKEIEKLPQIIEEKIHSKMDKKDSVIFLSALLNGSFPGFARSPGDCKSRSLTKENVKLLAKGIIKYMNFLEKIRSKK